MATASVNDGSLFHILSTIKRIDPSIGARFHSARGDGASGVLWCTEMIYGRYARAPKKTANHYWPIAR